MYNDKSKRKTLRGGNISYYSRPISFLGYNTLQLGPVIGEGGEQGVRAKMGEGEGNQEGLSVG